MHVALAMIVLIAQAGPLLAKATSAKSRQKGPPKAEPAPIGGDLRHELTVPAPTGESAVFYASASEESDWPCGALRADDAHGHPASDQCGGPGDRAGHAGRR